MPNKKCSPTKQRSSAKQRFSKKHRSPTEQGPHTLAIDIGGTNIKVMVLDPCGDPINERIKTPTPKNADPVTVLNVIMELVRNQPPFDRVSVGFPGVVRTGVTRTAPNLKKGAWRDFPLAKALSEKLKKPVRAANDADVQGFGAIRGEGVELVITLGTGLGSALFVDGILAPNLELAHHPFRDNKTYEQNLGKAALERIGEEKWRAMVDDAVDLLRQTFNFDMLYLGGGHAARLDPDSFADDVKIIRNIAGLLGGIALWTNVRGTSLVRAPHAPGAHSEIPVALPPVKTDCE